MRGAGNRDILAGMNSLYFGDNLDVLRRYVADDSIDLVYLDPPFNSDQNYNVLFAEQDGTRSAAQIHAFEDTWQWDEGAALAFQEVVECGDSVADALIAFRTVLKESNMLSYLSMMAPRLKELHRVLKSSGSLYLHCDTTACHYLKMLLDAVFGPGSFRNQIVWKRTAAHNDAKQGSKHFGRTHDVLLLYTIDRDKGATWNQIYTPLDKAYIESHYGQVDGNGRRFMWDNITGPGGAAKGNPFYEVLGVQGYWRFSRERMQRLIDAGLVAIPPKGKTPRQKRYLDEQKGRPLGDVWTDVPPINSQAQERLGYPTQKPESLLERIIAASSNPGDIVLDPFCGCGTAVAAAQKLGRQWVGIDITALAISLIKNRLATTYGEDISKCYKVIGEPVSLADARALAEQDKYQFQWWALGLVNARPVEQKKGADKGIDGRILFHDEHTGGKTKQIIISVKGGNLQAGYIRDLRGVIEREKAAIGVLISIENPTGPMKREAASAGFYKSPYNNQDYPRLQILTIEELLTGKTINAPLVKDSRVQTIKGAPKAKVKKTHKQTALFDEG